jgi:DNA-binding NarL/FixJ family response regulator
MNRVLANGHRLLVVDPDAAFARTAQCWLREGFPTHDVRSATGLNTKPQPAPRLAVVEAAHLDHNWSSVLAATWRRWPQTRILLYDEPPPPAALHPFLATNLAGWLVKPLRRPTLVAAVAAVLEGCRVLDAPSLIASNRTTRNPAPGMSTPVPRRDLSFRQAQILDLLALGKTEKEVAHQLQMSPHTVNHHIERLYRKWGVRNRAEALRHWLLP